jgi:single-strand DNA-binding protein
MNKAILTGRITDNLEVKKTQSNKSVVNYSIAVDKGTKDEFGNRQATFIEIQSWNQQAEFLAQYAGKGALISVVGRIENSSYTNNEGTKIKRTYIVSENVEILNKPNKEVQQSIKKEQDNFGVSYPEIKSDDLPFY